MRGTSACTALVTLAGLAFGCAAPAPAARSPVADVGGPGAPRSEAAAPAPATPGRSSVRMVRVPAGRFALGGAGADGELAVRIVALEAFAIDETETTDEDYERCVSAGACRRAGRGPRCSATLIGKRRRPVTCIDFHQARAYCAWAGKRLPTEEEWEAAARGEDGRLLPWLSDGSDVEHRVCAPSGEEETCEVGRFVDGKSPFGALDMAGNAAEWTSTLFVTPAAPGRALVTKSGSFRHPSDILAPRRRARLPGAQSPDLGFRCVSSSRPAPPIPPGVAGEVAPADETEAELVARYTKTWRRVSAAKSQMSSGEHERRATVESAELVTWNEGTSFTVKYRVRLGWHVEANLDQLPVRVDVPASGPSFGVPFDRFLDDAGVDTLLAADPLAARLIDIPREESMAFASREAALAALRAAARAPIDPEHVTIDSASPGDAPGHLFMRALATVDAKKNVCRDTKLDLMTGKADVSDRPCARR